MIVSFQLSSLPVTPWKNGGGETREIVSVPSPDAPFLWRASIATLQTDGPFSPFPGVDRVITLIDGSSLWLRGGDIAHHLSLWEPWAFAGEWAIASEGISPPGLDFNIMTQRSRATAQVSVVSAAQRPGATGIAYVLEGRWRLGEQLYDAQSGIWWQDASPGALLPQSVDARVLLANISVRQTH